MNFDASGVATGAKNLFNIVREYSPEIQKRLWEIILKNGIATKEGLDNSLKEIE